MSGDILLIGASSRPGDFSRYLQEDDPCFGKHFARTVKECLACVAPVIMDQKLYLIRDLCEARCQGADSPGSLQVLAAQDVLARLESGQSVQELFQAILGDSEPALLGAAARQMLSDRFAYLRSSRKLLTPPLPPLKELQNNVRD